MADINLLNQQPQQQLCPMHGICAEKIAQNEKDIMELNKEVSQLKTEVSNIKIEQTKESERIITLYNVVNEIKDSMKTLANGIESLSTKMDEGFDKMNDKLDDKIEKQNEKMEELRDKQDEKIEKIKEKPDAFKEKMINLAWDTLKLGVSGGILFTVFYGAGKIFKLF